MLDFTDKVVVITGAASGFGKLLSEKLYALNANLVISDMDENAVQKVANDLGERAIALHCDATQKSDVQAQIDAALNKFGRVDIVVNNAGMAATFTSLIDINEADFDKMISNHSKGVFFGMQAQISQMLMQDLAIDDKEDFLGAASPMEGLPPPKDAVDVMISIISPKNTYRYERTMYCGRCRD